MCGRDYSTYTDEELFLRYLNKRPLAFPRLTPNFNIAPTQNCLVLRVIEKERKFDYLRWGLVPFWAKDVKSASRYSLINAKAAEIAEKRSYKGAFEKRRCIVPLSGFFERKKEGTKRKRPFCIRLKDEPVMNTTPKPFIWTATVESIRKKLSGCKQTLEKIQPGYTLPRFRKTRRNNTSRL